MPAVSRSILCTTLLTGMLPALLGIQPALAQGTPRSMSDCERLKNDLAYNQCLAMFGPEARNIAGGDGGRGGTMPSMPEPAPLPEVPKDRSVVAGIPDVEEPLLTEPRRSRRGRQARSNGRQRASFDIIASDSGADSMGSSSDRRSRKRWRRR